MTQAQDALALERELNGAKVNFNIARRALASALNGYISDGGEDRIIHHADEYGLEHTLEILDEQPNMLGVGEKLSREELRSVSEALGTAYTASHVLDDAMAKREALLSKINPRRMKRLMIGEMEVIFDPEEGVLRDASNGRAIAVEIERIEPNDDYKYEQSM